MPFYFFTSKISGRFKPAEVIESERNQLYEDYLEFQKVEKSEELKIFQNLETEINSSEFIQKKKEIQNLHFKGSKEHKQLTDFKKLSGSKAIKQFLQLEDSERLKRFEKIKDSKELNEYFELQEYINDGVFKEEKKTIESQTFKGSSEEKKIKEYKKLKKSKILKNYLKVHAQNSDNTDTIIPKEYQNFLQLEKELQSDEFIQRKNYLQDKNKFKKTAVYKKFIEYKQLQKSPDISFYQSFKKSKKYKNYLQIKDSNQINDYYELKGIIESKEFAERKAYLKDKKRWEKTEGNKKEQKYLLMKSLPHLIRYNKYKEGDHFDIFKNWKNVFEEEFTSNQLSENKWITCSYWGYKMNGGNFSQPEDLQCFSNGKNLKISNNRLKIQVKKEKSKGKIWNPDSGFIPVEFNYTSDIINTGNSFWIKDGIVEAKIKFTPQKEIVSFFSLYGETPSLQVNLLEMGTKNRMGTFVYQDGKHIFNGVPVKGLKKGVKYLFRIEKNDGKITWIINDKKIFEQTSSDFQKPMFINISNIVVNEISEAILPYDFEIDWIRCYEPRI